MEGAYLSYSYLNDLNKKLNAKELALFEKVLLTIDSKLSAIEAEINAPPPMKMDRTVTRMALLRGPLYLFFNKPTSFLKDIDGKTTYQRPEKQGIVRTYNLFNQEIESFDWNGFYGGTVKPNNFYVHFYEQRCSTIFKLDKTYPNQTTSRVASTKYLGYCLPEYTNDDRKLQALSFMNGFKLKARKRKFSDVFNQIMGKALSSFSNYNWTPYLKMSLDAISSRYGEQKIADFPAVVGQDETRSRTTFYKTLNVYAIFLDSDIEITL